MWHFFHIPLVQSSHYHIILPPTPSQPLLLRVSQRKTGIEVAVARKQAAFPVPLPIPPLHTPVPHIFPTNQKVDKSACLTIILMFRGTVTLSRRKFGMSHIFLCSANSGLCREGQLLAGLTLAIEATLQLGESAVAACITIQNNSR